MTWTRPRTTILDETGSTTIRHDCEPFMDVMQRDRRDSFIAAGRPSASGFSLVEMLVTLALGGILLAIAAPPFGRLNADIRARSTAEQLAGALRLAQASAVTRNRTAAFVLTNATPDADAAAAANGSNWLVKLLPATPTRDSAAGAELIQVATVAAQNRVTLTGPAQVCFDALGLQASTAAAAGALSTACAEPGGDFGDATSYLVSRTGAPRQFKVRVYRTGRVEVCDAAKGRSADKGGCL